MKSLAAVLFCLAKSIMAKSMSHHKSFYLYSVFDVIDFVLILDVLIFAV